VSEKESKVNFTKQEADLIARYARQHGISEDEAATQIFQSELARRIKKRTGKAPAKIYSFRTRK
jgi:hypothetical protein